MCMLLVVFHTTNITNALVVFESHDWVYVCSSYYKFQDDYVKTLRFLENACTWNRGCVADVGF